MKPGPTEHTASVFEYAKANRGNYVPYGKIARTTAFSLKKKYPQFDWMTETVNGDSWCFIRFGHPKKSGSPGA